jgi:hypothetical protein
VQRELGKDQLPSDFEIELFDTVFEVLETGFDVLTINKKVFDNWQEIVSSAATKLQTAGVIAGGSLALLISSVFQAGSAGSAAGVAAGTVAAEATGVAAGTMVAAEVTSVAAASAAAGTTATGAATGAAATGATLGSTMCSAAVLGPLALFVAGAGLCAIHCYHHRKSSKEKDQMKTRESL